MGSEIDLKSLDKALAQFGSLEKAVQALQARKLELENDVAQLSPRKTKLEQEVAFLEKERTSYSDALEKLDAAFTEKWWQFELFTGFMALVNAQSPQDIAQFAATAQKWVKVSVISPALARQEIIEELMGRVVKAFRCSSCGTRFLVDRRPQRPWGKYRCPACSTLVDAEPDDSLIKLFLSPERVQEMNELEKLQAEVDRLTAVEVFLDIPCRVCGKPMPSNWKRYEVERIFRACGMAHRECWGTPIGLRVYTNEFLKAMQPKDLGQYQQEESQLEARIAAREQTVADIKKLETDRQTLLEELAQARTEIAQHEEALEMLKGFEWFIAAQSWEEMDRFINLLPRMFARAKAWGGSQSLFRKSVLRELTGGALRVLYCTNCDTTFATNRPHSIYAEDYFCPVCGSSNGILVVRDEEALIRAALPSPRAGSQSPIVVRLISHPKPGDTETGLAGGGEGPVALPEPK